MRELRVSGERSAALAAAAPAAPVTFHVVTPCLNAAATIGETLLSVVTQTGDFRLRYHVQDGGSTDSTVALLERFADFLAAQSPWLIRCRELVFSFATEKDAGIYDGVRRGVECLTMESDAFMTWLNADDLLLPGALATVHAAVTQYPEVEWLTGNPCIVGEDGRRFSPTMRAAFATELVRDGLNDLVHCPLLQQEGSFWRRRLWDRAGGVRTDLRLAADYDLWRRFAQHAELTVIDAQTAAFRRRTGQASEDREKYFDEVAAVLPLAEREQRWRAVESRVGVGERIQCRRILPIQGGYRNESFNLGRELFPLAGMQDKRQQHMGTGLLFNWLRKHVCEYLVIRDLRRSGLFFASYYLDLYPDVATSRQDPVQHYVREGAYKGLRPNPLFDSRFYLCAYRDVAAVGMNPLYHYLHFGAALGCDPDPRFSTSAHLERYPELKGTTINPLLHYLTVGILTENRGQTGASSS